MAADGAALDRIGVVGAGMMGAGMAECLMRAGHPVTVWSRRGSEGARRLVAGGAVEAGDVAELVAGCDVLLTCVSDAQAVDAVAERALPVLRPRMLWIDATTSDPAVTRRLAERVSRVGAVLVDAPVTGGPPEAEAGTLFSLVGCPEPEWARVRELVARYSKDAVRFGETGTGHTAKLLNNLVTQGTMALLVEAYGLARRHDVDRAALYEAMTGGAARSGTLLKAVGPALKGDFDGARFSISNAEKDLRYAAALTNAEEGDWLVHAAHARLRRAVEEGRGGHFVSRLLEP